MEAPAGNSHLVDFDRDCYSQERLCPKMRRFVGLALIRSAVNTECSVVNFYYHTDNEVSAAWDLVKMNVFTVIKFCSEPWIGGE